MDKTTTIKYEALKVADVAALAEDGLAVIVLETDKGQIGLHMKPPVFELLGLEIRQALERAASLPRKR